MGFYAASGKKNRENKTKDAIKQFLRHRRRGTIEIKEINNKKNKTSKTLSCGTTRAALETNTRKIKSNIFK